MHLAGRRVLPVTVELTKMVAVLLYLGGVTLSRRHPCAITTPRRAPDAAHACGRAAADGDFLCPDPPRRGRRAATPESAGDLGPVLTAMLATTPADRPTARAAKSMLEKVAGIDLASAPVTMAASSPRRGVRRWGLGAAAGATLVVAERSASTATPSAVPAGMGTMNEQRSADPCALLLEETVSWYGKIFRDTEYGNFNRCGLWIEPGPTGEEIVSVAYSTLSRSTAG